MVKTHLGGYPRCAEYRAIIAAGGNLQNALLYDLHLTPK